MAFDVTTVVAASTGANVSGAGTNYVVKTIGGAYYVVYIDSSLTQLYYRKSTDGVTWSEPVSIAAITVANVAVWYDRWSNISAGLIHVAYTGSAADDTFYRSIDTENSDTLGTQTVIFAGSSTATGGTLSIARARGGNLYCHSVIDAGAEGGFFRSTDVGANWTSRTVNEAIATTDQIIMLPGWAADNQDMMAFFWDADADEVSRYLYDDSGDAWAESSIAATMADVVATVTYPHFAAAVDITNSRNLLLAWSAVDTLNADLRCWHVTESAITEVTNVVTNSTDDQGFCAIGIDTDTQDWYAFYGGLSDGSETFATNIRFYYKVSTDDGATWGSETLVTPSTINFNVSGFWCTPRFNTKGMTLFQNSSGGLFASSDVTASGGARVIGG